MLPALPSASSLELHRFKLFMFVQPYVEAIVTSLGAANEQLPQVLVVLAPCLVQMQVTVLDVAN